MAIMPSWIEESETPQRAHERQKANAEQEMWSSVYRARRTEDPEHRADELFFALVRIDPTTRRKDGFPMEAVFGRLQSDLSTVLSELAHLQSIRDTPDIQACNRILHRSCFILPFLSGYDEVSGKESTELLFMVRSELAATIGKITTLIHITYAITSD